MPSDREQLETLEPWAPDGVPAELLAHAARLRYIVVDEIVGDLVTLSVSRWPGSDALGRVRFADSDPGASRTCGHLLVHRRELHDRLYEGWLRREPRVGDVFAAELGSPVSALVDRTGDAVLDDRLRLADAFPGPVVDISAEARTLAKLAFYAAAAGVQRHEQARALGQVHGGGGRPAPRVREVSKEPWDGPVLPRARSLTDAARSRWTVPADRWPEGGEGGLVEAIRGHPTALFYFLLNVGDGDSQLLLLPEDAGTRRRRAVVVDAGTTGKLPGLMAALAENSILPAAGGPDEVCALVVATHPHDDHIEGLAELLRTYGRSGVGDFWEPGYYAPTRAFAELMAAVEDCRIRHCEPTAGMVRYVGGTRISVLAPSVQLRTAYDTYGVDCNNASIVLKVEFPAVRIAAQQHDGRQTRRDLGLHSPWSMILGADAQTRSWSHVTAEFPQLHRGHNTAVFRSLREAQGRDYLSAHILKVSHHASKHGINLELIERVRPRVTLVSSVGGGGRYGFPHALATQAIAEALAPSVRTGTARPEDADLGIHYTGGSTEDGRPLGSVALLVPAKRRSQLLMWRFGDLPGEDVPLDEGRVLSPIYAPD